MGTPVNDSQCPVCLEIVAIKSAVCIDCANAYDTLVKERDEMKA